MNRPMISIIIPVYNTEKYIDECLESVVSQSFSDFEIIVIDDGSSDDSFNKLEQWKIKDNRIRILSTANNGVSHARNLGINNAMGKWLMFLDSDDYLLSDCLEKLVKCCSKNVQEVCANYINENYKIVKELKIQEILACNMIKMTLDPINNHLLPDFYDFHESSFMSSCAKLYAKEIIDKYNIRFNEQLRLSEDMLFHLVYLSHIKTVGITNLSVFYYRTHKNSVTKNFNISNLDNRFLFFEELNKLKYESSVHQLTMLLLLICQMEKYVDKLKKNPLEKEIVDYLKKNNFLFINTQNKMLSLGKWQNKVYLLVRFLFKHRLYSSAFCFLRIYSKLAKGEI